MILIQFPKSSKQLERGEKTCLSDFYKYPGPQSQILHCTTNKIIQGLNFSYFYFPCLVILFSLPPHFPFCRKYVRFICLCLFVCLYFASCLGQAMTTVAVHVDSKAELTTLLEQWEKEHGSGQDMVPILTRYDQLSGFF